MNVNIISSTKLNVSWEPLSKKDSRGVIVDYKLLWKLHQSSSRLVQYLPASIEYYIISGMIFVYLFSLSFIKVIIIQYIIYHILRSQIWNLEHNMIFKYCQEQNRASQILVNHNWIGLL